MPAPEIGKIAGGSDDTRSGLAFRRARDFQRQGRSFEEYVAALGADPETATWVVEKGLADDRRQLRRAWERAGAANREALRVESERPCGVCPVCGEPDASLVGHHDHFADLCTELVGRSDWYKSSWGKFFSEWCELGSEVYYEQYLALPRVPEYEEWATFPKTLICGRCNAVDAQIKQRIAKLPRWVSFAPGELVRLREPGWLSAVVEIWPARKELYRPQLRRLVAEFGVSRDAITAAWRDRSRQSYDGAIRNRKAMLQRLAAAPPEMRELCKTPGNEIELAKWIRELGWPWLPGGGYNFIYWYHKQHGDPQCRNNQFGIAEGRFVRWFGALVAGDKAKAARILDDAIYWDFR